MGPDQRPETREGDLQSSVDARESSGSPRTVSLSIDEDVSDEVCGILERAVDGLVEGGPPVKRSTIVEALRRNRPTPQAAIKVAWQARSQIQAEGRAPNAAALFAAYLD